MFVLFITAVSRELLKLDCYNTTAVSCYGQHHNLSPQIRNYTVMSPITSLATMNMTLFRCSRLTSMGITYIQTDSLLVLYLTTQ